MIEPVAVAVHAVRKAQFDRGANVWVMGAGTIGLMTVQVARALGAEGVIVSDLIQDRLDLARELGATAVFNPRLSDSRQEIAKIFKDGADVIVECVGVTTTIHDAIKTARKGTQIILAGVFEQDTPVPLGLVQDRELELVGTLMYQYDDFPLAIELVESGEVKVDPLVTHHFPLAETAKAFATADSRGNALKVIIDVH
jgi:L-iditol 2-dehydrogenase